MSEERACDRTLLYGVHLQLFVVILLEIWMKILV